MPSYGHPIWSRLWLYSPLVLVLGGLGTYLMRNFAMPGRYHADPLPPITATQKQLAAELRAIVTELADKIGERHLRKPERLEEAALFVEAELAKTGFHPRRQELMVDGVTCRNIEATVKGVELPDELVVVGAHYDSAVGTPGADDNASGVATLLYLAGQSTKSPPRRTLRFVAFVNEEPPYFRTKDMGSVRYAAELASTGQKVAAMLSLETLGYYTDEPHSQSYPSFLEWVFPDTGNFVAFVANSDSVGLVRQTVGIFREHAQFPALGAVLAGVASGAELSDNWAFSRHGIPALMVTDTAMMRTPHYHGHTDTVDTIDFERLARVSEGLSSIVQKH